MLGEELGKFIKTPALKDIVLWGAEASVKCLKDAGRGKWNAWVHHDQPRCGPMQGRCNVFSNTADQRRTAITAHGDISAQVRRQYLVADGRALRATPERQASVHSCSGIGGSTPETRCDGDIFS